MHFSYAVGSILGPLLAEPFLSIEKKSSNSTDSEMMNYPEEVNNSSEIEFDFNANHSESLKNSTLHEKSVIYVPYLIGSFLMILNAVLFITLLIVIRKRVKELRTHLDESLSDSNAVENPTTTDKEPGSGNSHSKLPGWKTYMIVVVALASLCLAFEGGLEINTANYLQTFIVNLPLNVPNKKKTGAFMSSVLNTSFTMSRFIAVFLALKLKTRTMLTINLIVITIGTLLIQFFATSSLTGLWTGIIIMGFGYSSTWPGIIAFVEERIRVNGLDFITFI